MSVLVVLEQRGGTWSRMSFEALAAGGKLARALGVPVEAAVLGGDVKQLAGEAARLDLAKVHAIQDPLLAHYTPDGYASALEQLVAHIKPEAVVFPHTYEVRDYAPKLAARFGRMLISDVIGVKAESNQPIVVRQLFQGKLNSDIRLAAGPQFVSVQAGAFRAVETSGVEHP